MDGFALLFAVAISLLSGVIFGILPALRIARQDPQEALKSGSHQNSEGPGGVWIRKALVAAEVAAAAVQPSSFHTPGSTSNSQQRVLPVAYENQSFE